MLENSFNLKLFLVRHGIVPNLQRLFLVPQNPYASLKGATTGARSPRSDASLRLPKAAPR